MKQYLELLKNIKEKGTFKPAARVNIPGTISLFGYQFRHNLKDGFPLLTTKKINFKNIIVELLWFLKGDTNIKYLIDNGCNIWNEDAYQFYLKKVTEISNMYEGEPPYNIIHEDIEKSCLTQFTFEEFVEVLKNTPREKLMKEAGYTFGDCGYQYGKVWRDWQVDEKIFSHYSYDSGEDGLGHHITKEIFKDKENVDQIATLIKGLKTNPQGRRHIITAIDPAHDTELALYWCHVMVQFNCRPISDAKRVEIYNTSGKKWAVKRVLGHFIYPEDYVPQHDDDIPDPIDWEIINEEREYLDEHNIPKYYLDCQMYQRSADVFLGVPYNIASYALLTIIISKLLNFIPGDFIHTFGDVHIYENHLESVNEQLSRTPVELPRLNINTEFWETDSEGNLSIEGFLNGLKDNTFLNLLLQDIQLSDYNPQKMIKGKLSTGLK